MSHVGTIGQAVLCLRAQMRVCSAVRSLFPTVQRPHLALPGVRRAEGESGASQAAGAAGTRLQRATPRAETARFWTVRRGGIGARVHMSDKEHQTEF